MYHVLQYTFANKPSDLRIVGDAKHLQKNHRGVSALLDPLQNNNFTINLHKTERARAGKLHAPDRMRAPRVNGPLRALAYRHARAKIRALYIWALPRGERINEALVSCAHALITGRAENKITRASIVRRRYRGAKKAP